MSNASSEPDGCHCSDEELFLVGSFPRADVDGNISYQCQINKERKVKLTRSQLKDNHNLRVITLECSPRIKSD